MIGKHFNTFSHPADANKNLHLFEDLVKGKIPYFDLEKRYIHKNGQTVYGLIRAQVIRDQNGKALFQTALIENITEQKKTIEAIKEKEQKFRDLANLLPQIVYEIDLKGNLTFANKFGIEAFGYSKEETSSNFNILQIIAPEDRERASSIVAKIIDENISGNPEYTCIKKDGSRVPVLIYSSVVYKKNKPTGMRGVIIDITERKKSELIQKAIYNISNAAITVDTVEKLIEIIRQQLSTIIDTTNFYVALYNPELDLLALPFFADEKDDLKFVPKGKSLTKYVFETKKSLLVDYKTEKELARKGIIEEIGTMSKIWMGVPLKIDEQVFGVLAVQSYTNENAYNQSDLKILEFVSEQISLSINRKKALDDLKLALEKATESDRLKSAFLATMSHELRTPLNAIIGFSEFLTPELDNESVGKFGEIIHKSGNHLLSIVNDLFDITLIESGETKLRKEEIILDSLILDVSNLIIAKQYRDNKTNIELKYYLPKDCEGFVFRTDENKLKQVLINLLKNALKFTTEGHIYYGCNLVKEETCTTLKFYVEDSGIGISKDKQEIIFEMFRQVEDGSTRKYEGAGIGLSVAKRLVELLGGTIWVESEINEGSTFYFTIPVEESRLEQNNIFDELTFLDIKDKVLIVEDNQASAEFIETVLNKYGLQCLFAENGQEAVDLCMKQNNIALVLMDINLPVKDGLAATKEIKQLKPDLPIIAQTAYAVAGDKEKALACGCDDYISKPINQKDLVEKLKLFLK
jgi:PAS domain S-box-containing protein